MRKEDFCFFSFLCVVLLFFSVGMGCELKKREEEKTGKGKRIWRVAD